MSSAKFLGINQYHEGTVVSDYVNMIPLGATAIDRLGEERLIPHAPMSGEGPDKIRGCFVDSKRNIYVVVEDRIQRYRYNEYDGTVTDEGVMGGFIGEARQASYKLMNGFSRVTFCESSTKPSQVFLCDGEYIYWWNTERPLTVNGPDERTSEFSINMLLSPNVTLNTGSHWYQAIDQRAELEVDTSVKPLNFDDRAEITSISWFDNRLVATQSDKNTVWLTCTDPAQFLRDLSKDPIAGESVQLWPDWYSSTNSADRLNQAVGFAGQLYLLNEGTIEIWSRTGTEDSPLQPNSLNTIYHGGRSPLILSNVMYLVCKDQIGGEYVGAIQAGGGFQRISNPEIERRFKNRIADIVPILVREDSFICVRDTDGRGNPTRHGFCYGQSGCWWQWYNQDGVTEFVAQSIIRDVALSNLGSIVRMKRDSRRLMDGAPIVRYIRDWFQHFGGRKIVRSIALVMDTGVRFSSALRDKNDRVAASDEIYCRVSTDRGRSFGPFVYRKLGSSGHNDKEIVWRNFGSGNSLLIEVGTSADYQVQLYDISTRLD